MKPFKQFRILLLVLVAICSVPRQATAQAGVRISFQTFYDQLSPYGYWMDTPEYGYVWQPNVATGFQPYVTNGYWIMTEYGNTWVSDYDWGWAPFHYGRWYFDDYYGWLWVPDTEWGPAWVSWRSSGQYYGWAPLEPGIGINVSSAYIPATRWVFVPHRYVTSRHFYNYCVPRTRVVNVYQNTTIINNYYTYNNRQYIAGPSAHDIEWRTRNRVTVHQVRNDNQPGRAVVQNGAVRVYRPEVSARNTSAAPTYVNHRPRSSRTDALRPAESFSPDQGRGTRSAPEIRTNPEQNTERRNTERSAGRSFDRRNVQPQEQDRDFSSGRPRERSPIKSDNTTYGRNDMNQAATRPTRPQGMPENRSTGESFRRAMPDQPQHEQNPGSRSGRSQEFNEERPPSRSFERGSWRSGNESMPPAAQPRSQEEFEQREQLRQREQSLQLQRQPLPEPPREQAQPRERIQLQSETRPARSASPQSDAPSGDAPAGRPPRPPR